jgi:hypothetical protein
MKPGIVTYTKEELKNKKGKTDFEKLRKTTDKDIEEQVKNDPDSAIPTEKELGKFKPAKMGRHDHVPF